MVKDQVVPVDPAKAQVRAQAVHAGLPVTQGLVETGQARLVTFPAVAEAMRRLVARND